MNLKDVVKKYGTIDENKVKQLRELFEDVKSRLIIELDSLKGLKYNERWNEILDPLKPVEYIESGGFFGNLSMALEDRYTREKIVDFIRSVESSKTIDEAYNAFRQLISDRKVKSAGITVASTLGHILKPDWFIPLNHKISKTIEKIGLTSIHLAGSRDHEEAIRIFRMVSRETEDLIRASYALYKYRADKNPLRDLLEYQKMKLQKDWNELWERSKDVLSRLKEEILSDKELTVDDIWEKINSLPEDCKKLLEFIFGVNARHANEVLNDDKV